jgi:hypothetical protein
VNGPVAFGVAISEDRRHCAIVAAGREKDGPRLVVDLVWYDHPRGAVARLTGLSAKHDPVDVALYPKSQSGTLVKPLFEAGILVKELTAQDMAVAHGEFLDLVNDAGRFAHLDQPPLTAAVRAGQQRPLAGAQAWDPKVETDQGPLVAATLAAWAFARWEELAQPGVWAVLGVQFQVRRPAVGADLDRHAQQVLRPGEPLAGFKELPADLAVPFRGHDPVEAEVVMRGFQAGAVKVRPEIAVKAVRTRDIAHAISLGGSRAPVRGPPRDLPARCAGRGVADGPSGVRVVRDRRLGGGGVLGAEPRRRDG